jgi:hypothetical protein
MAASIQLADGRSLNVSESVAEIQAAITSLGPVITPMIPLTEFGPAGQPVLVFAANITSVKDLG